MSNKLAVYAQMRAGLCTSSCSVRIDVPF